ncbi:MAG: hypothetical protein QOJ46_2703 [bacterium]
MKATLGSAAVTLKIGDPQAEQKLRSVSSPWSVPVVANEASVLPSTVSAARGTPTITENGLPVWRWQSVQWHAAWATGAASAL